MSTFVELNPEQITAALESHPSTYRFMVRKCQNGAAYCVVKTCDGIRFLTCSKHYKKLEDANQALEIRARLSRTFKATVEAICQDPNYNLPWQIDRSRCF